MFDRPYELFITDLLIISGEKHKQNIRPNQHGLFAYFGLGILQQKEGQKKKTLVNENI